MQATSVNNGAVSQPTEKPTTKVWRLCPFRNPARSDGLVLRHWRKVVRCGEPAPVAVNAPIELKEKYASTLDSTLSSTLPKVDEELAVIDSYPFAKIAPAIKIYRYSDEFYRYQISDLDPSWTKEETDLLFDLCEMFELRFIAIHDRFKWRKDVTLEKLKHRYYTVTKRIIEFSFEEKIKAELAKHNNPAHPVVIALRDEASRHPLVKFCYNMEHDRDRRQMLDRSYKVSQEQKEAEEKILEDIKEAESLVKREERKKSELKKLKRKFSVIDEAIALPNMDKLNSKDVWLASEIVTHYKAQLNQKHNDAVDEMLAALNIPTPVISSRASNELYCVVRGDAAIMINLVNKVDSLKKELEYWKASAGPLPDHITTPKTKDKITSYLEAADAATAFQTPRAMMPTALLPKAKHHQPQHLMQHQPPLVEDSSMSHGDVGHVDPEQQNQNAYYQQQIARQRMMMVQQQMHQQLAQQQSQGQHQPSPQPTPPQVPQAKAQQPSQQQQPPPRNQMQQVYPMKLSPNGTSSPHVFPQQGHYQQMMPHMNQQQHMGQQSPMAKQPSMPQVPQHGMPHAMMAQHRMMQQRMMQYAPYSQQAFQPMPMRIHPQGMYYPNQMFAQGPQPHYGHMIQHGIPHQQAGMHQMGQNAHLQPQHMGAQGQLQGSMPGQLQGPMGGHMTPQMQGAMSGQLQGSMGGHLTPQMQGQPGGGQPQQMGSHQVVLTRVSVYPSSSFARALSDVKPPLPSVPCRFLYQPALPFEGVSATIQSLAEKACASTSSWKSRIEGRVLSLNVAAREEATALIGPPAVSYTVRHPFSKFSGVSNRGIKRAGLLCHGPTINYEHAEALQRLWLEYISDVLGNQSRPQNIVRTLALCDLQGAKVDVVSSRCPSYVGISGIIVRETQHGFYIVKVDSTVSLVLKSGTVFALEWNNCKFHIYGAHLTATPAHRSKRKFKSKSHL
ncbi:SWR1-complex protein 4 [Babesia sp. Xinjiang]|uniref:SWR1-complex protein 4 n=1 Tax=Babesia sp. Xinjiang TaxID=462227 RepID=UPI000A2577D5|nr:SWR1-complex protein 4 [Babesia sp. Xinjiang]ORM39579.1 SWR1-complex protein 4 [Babesia sp. Xinjiang]